jgi:hypothetical protein
MHVAARRKHLLGCRPEFNVARMLEGETFEEGVDESDALNQLPVA